MNQKIENGNCIILFLLWSVLSFIKPNKQKAKTHLNKVLEAVRSHTCLIYLMSFKFCLSIYKLKKAFQLSLTNSKKNVQQHVKLQGSSFYNFISIYIYDEVTSVSILINITLQAIAIHTISIMQENEKWNEKRMKKTCSQYTQMYFFLQFS